MGLETLRVLVVDDHKLMSQILGVMLRAFNVQHVRFAATSGEAREILSATPFDIVVTDYEMPGESGLDLVRWIRTSKASHWPQMPVILVTAYSDVKRIEQARDAGVTEIAVKPISAQMLMSRLVSAIDHPRPFVRAPGFVGPDRRRRATPGYAGPERRRRRDDVEID